MPMRPNEIRQHGSGITALRVAHGDCSSLQSTNLSPHVLKYNDLGRGSQARGSRPRGMCLLHLSLSCVTAGCIPSANANAKLQMCEPIDQSPDILLPQFDWCGPSPFIQQWSDLSLTEHTSHDNSTARAALQPWTLKHGMRLPYTHSAAPQLHRAQLRSTSDS